MTEHKVTQDESLEDYKHREEVEEVIEASRFLSQQRTLRLMIPSNHMKTKLYQ